MRVYRYLNIEYGLEALQTRTWKLGRLRELNDPFDCRPCLINVPSLKVGVAAEAFLNLLAEKVGLLCFSSRIKDPVLWSHYAESHKGLALGFDLTEQQCVRTRYSNRRPIVDYKDLEKAGETENSKPLLDLIFKGFSTKAKSWSYEEEYRFFILLDNCTMKGRHYFRGLLTEQLREVVLGARSSVTPYDINRILYDGMYPKKVKIKQCRLNPSSFGINLKTHARAILA